MNMRFFSILFLALFSASVLFGCTAEEIQEEAEDYRRAKESAKRSMVDKPVEHTPVGDPFSRAKDISNEPAEPNPNPGK